jgi:hypothetical protein
VTITPVPVRKKGKALWVLLMVFVLAGGFYAFCGFYSIQPLGALPEGRTAIVWRAKGEPFFNSADALCLERMGGVSLLCRGLAMGQAPTDRIIVRLPFQRWAYLASTDGKEFDR